MYKALKSTYTKNIMNTVIGEQNISLSDVTRQVDRDYDIYLTKVSNSIQKNKNNCTIKLRTIMEDFILTPKFIDIKINDFIKEITLEME